MMNVEDIASQISVIFGIQHDWRDQISGVYVSPGSAETLARGGGITNHHLIAYSLSNISAKELPKSVNVRWSYSVLYQCRFLRHSVWFYGSFFLIRTVVTCRGSDEGIEVRNYSCIYSYIHSLILNGGRSRRHIRRRSLLWHTRAPSETHFPESYLNTTGAVSS